MTSPNNSILVSITKKVETITQLLTEVANDLDALKLDSQDNTNTAKSTRTTYKTKNVWKKGKVLDDFPKGTLVRVEITERKKSTVDPRGQYDLSKKPFWNLKGRTGIVEKTEKAYVHFKLDEVSGVTDFEQRRYKLPKSLSYMSPK